MKKKIILSFMSTILISCLLVTGCSNPSSGDPTGGALFNVWDGDYSNVEQPTQVGETNVYEISTASQLAWLGENSTPSGNVYRLKANIDLKGHEWKPITGFKGTFDGEGRIIKGLKLANTGDTVGFFGSVGGTSEQHVSIKNLTLEVDDNNGGVVNNSAIHRVGVLAGVSNYLDIENVSIKGGKLDVTSASFSYELWIGGIAGRFTDSTLKNVTVEIDINAVSEYKSIYAGGLIGLAEGLSSIENCNKSGNISATADNSVMMAGGLVGTGEISIKNSTVTGNITITAKNNIDGGGLIGRAGKEILNCSVTGNLTANNKAGEIYAGGIAGSVFTDDSIESCSFTGELGASSENGRINAGGITGKFDDGVDGAIEHCSSIGAITASSDNGRTDAGGIAGSMCTINQCFSKADVKAVSLASYATAGGISSYGYASECYSWGTVTAEGNTSAFAGGIVGVNEDSTTMCYSIGNVSAKPSAGASYSGGIAGSDNAGSISSCYAVGNISGVSISSAFHTYAGGIAGTGDNISKCFAFSGSVVTSGEGGIIHIGRVVGEGNSLSDNKANSEMTLNGDDEITGSATDENGANIEYDDLFVYINEPEFIDAIGWTAANWKFKTGEYPKLAWEK